MGTWKFCLPNTPLFNVKSSTSPGFRARRSPPPSLAKWSFVRYRGVKQGFMKDPVHDKLIVDVPVCFILTPRVFCRPNPQIRLPITGRHEQRVRNCSCACPLTRRIGYELQRRLGLASFDCDDSRIMTGYWWQIWKKERCCRHASWSLRPSTIWG